MSYLLGADPEFQLMYDGELQIASEVLSGFEAEFGIDGGGDVAEIRPTPCNNPAELVRNIRAALLAGYEELGGEYEWLAGTGIRGGSPTGGHLHLGLACSPEKLDTYIGMPLAAIEPAKGRYWRRRDGGYGYWADYRTQPWGVEYRTPSSWLVSPATARVAAALAWLLARNEERLPVPGWIGNLGHGCGKLDQDEWLKTAATKVLRELKNLPDYKKVAGMLEPYPFILDVVGDWREHRDMIETWRLDNKKPDTTPPPPVEEGEAEEDRLLAENRCMIVWNTSDEGMGGVKDYCGMVKGADDHRLWAVGAKKKRGANILLSPALARNRRVRQVLAKHKRPSCVWPDYPERNGELVIGLPLEMRTDEPDKAGMIVRIVALAAFSRLPGKESE